MYEQPFIWDNDWNESMAASGSSDVEMQRKLTFDIKLKRGDVSPNNRYCTERRMVAENIGRVEVVGQSVFENYPG